MHTPRWVDKYQCCKNVNFITYQLTQPKGQGSLDHGESWCYPWLECWEALRMQYIWEAKSYALSARLYQRRLSYSPHWIQAIPGTTPSSLSPPQPCKQQYHHIKQNSVQRKSWRNWLIPQLTAENSEHKCCWQQGHDRVWQGGCVKCLMTYIHFVLDQLELVDQETPLQT